MIYIVLHNNSHGNVGFSIAHSADQYAVEILDQTARWSEFPHHVLQSVKKLGGASPEHIKYPAANASVEEWHNYRSAKTLRLMPGDVGYVAWIAALQFFVFPVKAASVRCHGD